MNAFYLSRAPLVGMLRAYPLHGLDLKYGMQSKLLAMTANESHGVTKNALPPKIMFRSQSPSKAAPRPSLFDIPSTKSEA